jgi:hypothetical protein
VAAWVCGLRLLGAVSRVLGHAKKALAPPHLGMATGPLLPAMQADRRTARVLGAVSDELRSVTHALADELQFEYDDEYDDSFDDLIGLGESQHPSVMRAAMCCCCACLAAHCLCIPSPAPARQLGSSAGSMHGREPHPHGQLMCRRGWRV